MPIVEVGAEIFRTDGQRQREGSTDRQTDRQTDRELIVSFVSCFAKAAKVMK